MAEQPPSDRRPRVRLVPPADSTTATSTNQRIQELAIANREAGAIINRVLRDPNRFHLKGNLYAHEFGFEVAPPLETADFNPHQITQVAQERWNLPLALQIVSMGVNHATLLLRGPRRNTDGRIEIVRYDPIYGDIQVIPLPNFDPNTWASQNWVMANPLAAEQLEGDSYDLTISGDSRLISYQRALTETKLAARQDLRVDSSNCVAHCLFTGALLTALKPDSSFTKQGRDNFQRDFNVRVLSAEEIGIKNTPKPRVRIIG